MRRTSRIVAALLPAFVLAAGAERKTTRSPDGVRIVYSAVGAGEPALVFIHGGLANRSFWDAELQAFQNTHRVIALDLAGHGESGGNRATWSLPQFGTDVKAVADAEKLNKIVLIGNSLGGPAAIEAALRMPGRVIGVIGVDTFQSLAFTLKEESMRQRAEAFRDDFPGSLRQMVKSLFHADADPKIIADAERRMQMPPANAYKMFLGLGGYDLATPARRLTVPLRAINGDLYPTDVEGNRGIKPDFDVIVMKHTGHYPMLERPEEFNRHLAAIVAALRR